MLRKLFKRKERVPGGLDAELSQGISRESKETCMYSHLLVIAIDFGTTFSGFAFSFRHQYQRDPTEVSGKVWRAKTHSIQVPTCILLKPDKTFKAFGYDAQDEYADLVSKEQHEDWYFFKHFKMQIYEKELTRDILLVDVIGNKLPALMIFAEAIKYIKDEALSICRNQVTVLKEEDIRWVLTTPAIWNDAAKQFMREAAQKAGISNDSLVIALEPEVASIYCRHIKLQRAEQTHGGVATAAFSPGTQYAVLDAGGGTIDITVHEVNTDGTLKETYQANGGPWGGTLVDEAFRQFIIKIIGGPIVHKFRKEFLEEYLDLMREFEMCKQNVSPKSTSTVRFKVPAVLLELFEKEYKEKIEDVLQQMNLKDGIEWKRDKMTLTADTMKRMFEEAVKQTTQHIKSFLDDKPSVTHVLMVGGFSESTMLQQSIRSALDVRNIQVLIPDDASNAVLKGAVIYGHDASSITHRTCRYTYGVDTKRLFIEGKHEEQRKVTDGRGKVRCDGCFDIHVTKGEMLCCGQWLDKQSYVVLSADQTYLGFPIFSSTEKTPTYTDESGCTRLGKLTISMSDTTDGLDRGAYVQFCYSGTELLVRATDKKNGKTIGSSFDFLG